MRGKARERAASIVFEGKVLKVKTDEHAERADKKRAERIETNEYGAKDRRVQSQLVERWNEEMNKMRAKRR